ncbi:ATP-dependent DNA helicase chl1 [Coemansia sp. RSA 1822]|nr:ATP-dependent DNA helicase chl1 [Coemansia sp. RSA 1822]
MVDLTEETRLATPQSAAEFSFPISTPYGIQVEFMQRLFETLERGEFGIFESPTGTGKSLSIICGSLTWLAHHHARAPSTTDDNDDDRPSWVRDYERKQRESIADPQALAREKYKKWVQRVRRNESTEQRERKQNARRMGAVRAKACKRGSETESPHDSDDEVVAEYHSGGENDAMGDGEYSESVRKLLKARANNRVVEDSDVDSDEDTDQDAEPEEPSINKIFYASRTHSQLQQFIAEIKRTKFGHATPCVTLGSRMQLCTNDEVRSGCTSSAMLNERCLELQQSGRTKRCGQLPVQRTPMLDLKDHAHTHAMDIEDLVVQARKLSVCAYYGARAAVQQAHVVALPYNMLLSRSAREALGVSLAGSVVIVDEAHNLVDTILATHSALLDVRCVTMLLDLVQRYFKKYWPRLRGSNVVHIRRTIALLRALDKYMRAFGATEDGATPVVVKGVNEFLHDAHADHINVFTIDRYLRESNIGRKLNMFADRQTHSTNDAKRPRAQGAAPQASEIAPASAVAALEAFIAGVGSPDRTGARIVVRNGTHGVELSYVLLDPSEAFGDLRREARAVVLAGGTMTPATDVVEQLLPRFGRLSRDMCSPAELKKLDPDQVQLFSWSHVVSPSHICALVIESGPTNSPLRFAFQDQQNTARIRECGQALAALCNVIPGGIVVFFPSYALLSKMLLVWRENGIIERIARRKPVVTEDAHKDVLSEYVEHVRGQSGGAVLLSVVGGRLSEGINFSDELGRAVVMVGVPFPSLASPELNERLAYYESIGQSAVSTAVGPTPTQQSMGPRSRSLYESLCMRAVNQSIGRAIRHRGDYAAIIFLDARYAEPRIARRLPAWIAGPDQTVSSCKFGPALARISAFFKQDFSV